MKRSVEAVAKKKARRSTSGAIVRHGGMSEGRSQRGCGNGNKEQSLRRLLHHLLHRQRPTNIYALHVHNPWSKPRDQKEQTHQSLRKTMRMLALHTPRPASPRRVRVFEPPPRSTDEPPRPFSGLRGKNGAASATSSASASVQIGPTPREVVAQCLLTPQPLEPDSVTVAPVSLSLPCQLPWFLVSLLVCLGSGPEETGTTVLREIICVANDSIWPDRASPARSCSPLSPRSVHARVCPTRSKSAQIPRPRSHHHAKLSSNHLRGDRPSNSPRASNTRSALTANNTTLRNPSLLAPSHPTSLRCHVSPVECLPKPPAMSSLAQVCPRVDVDYFV